MAIVQWTPMSTPMLNDLDRFFDDAWLPIARSERFAPAVDVSEDANAVIVETPLAGVDPKNVTINIEDNVLTISGHHEQKREVDDQHFYRKEIRHGSFTRSVMLPKAVKADAADATFDKGMLKITLPKAEEAKPKTIAINIKN